MAVLNRDQWATYNEYPHKIRPFRSQGRDLTPQGTEEQLKMIKIMRSIKEMEEIELNKFHLHVASLECRTTYTRWLPFPILHLSDATSAPQWRKEVS
jgi:hypothetical protein